MDWSVLPDCAARSSGFKVNATYKVTPTWTASDAVRNGGNPHLTSPHLASFHLTSPHHPHRHSSASSRTHPPDQFAILGVDSEREWIVASFKGTNSTDDWLTDFFGGNFPFASCEINGNDLGHLHAVSPAFCSVH